MIAEPHVRQLLFNWNPIALWLLIHGGDPAPEQVKGAERVALALSIHKLAASLDDASRKTIQGAVANVIAQGARELTAG